MGALFSGGSGDSKDMLPMMGALGAMGSMMGGGAGGGLMGLLPMLMMGLMGKDEDTQDSAAMRGRHSFMDETGMSRGEYKDVYGQKGYQQEIGRQAEKTGFMPSDYELMDKGYEGYGQTTPKSTVASAQKPAGVGMANNQDAGQTGMAAQKPFDLKGMATGINEMAAQREADANKMMQGLQTQMASMKTGLAQRPQGMMPTAPAAPAAQIGMQGNIPSQAMQAMSRQGQPAGVGAQPSLYEAMRRLRGL